MNREMGSPRTEIQRYIISTDSCYLHGQRDVFPTDRKTERYNLHGQFLSLWTGRWHPTDRYKERQSPRIEKHKYHRQRDVFSVAANARIQGRWYVIYVDRNMGLLTGRLWMLYAVFLCTTYKEHWNMTLDALMPYTVKVTFKIFWYQFLT